MYQMIREARNHLRLLVNLVYDFSSLATKPDEIHPASECWPAWTRTYGTGNLGEKLDAPNVMPKSCASLAARVLLYIVYTPPVVFGWKD